jgi:hypothetical protein
MAETQESRWNRFLADFGDGAWFVAGIVLAVRMFFAPLKRTTLISYERGCDAWWNDTFYYETHLDYIYPPTFTIAYSPIGWLPDWLGAPVWTLLGLGVAWLGIKAFLRDVAPARLSPKQRSLCLALALFGLFRGLWAAQANALVIGLALLAVSAVVRRKWWSASFCLAAPIFIKLWPAALAMLLVPLKFRPLAGRLAAVSLGLAAIPWLTRAWDIAWRQHAGYVDLILHRRVDARFSGYRDLWTIWEQFQTPDPQLYKLLQLTTAACVFAWCVWLAWRKESDRRLATGLIGMWLTWQLLVGPGTERLTFGIMAPLMAWAIVESLRRGRGTILSTTAYLLLFVLGTGDVETALLPYLSWSPALAPGGSLLFLGWLLTYFRAPQAGATYGSAADCESPSAIPVALQSRAA